MEAAIYGLQAQQLLALQWYELVREFDKGYGGGDPKSPERTDWKLWYDCLASHRRGRPRNDRLGSREFWPAFRDFLLEINVLETVMGPESLKAMVMKARRKRDRILKNR